MQFRGFSYIIYITQSSPLIQDISFNLKRNPLLMSSLDSFLPLSLHITHLLPVSMDLHILEFYINGIMQYIDMVFYNWLLSFCEMVSKLTGVACVDIHSFLWLNNIALYGYTTFCLSTHKVTDTWVVSTLWLLRNNAAINICVQILMETYISIFLG